MKKIKFVIMLFLILLLSSATLSLISGNSELPIVISEIELNITEIIF
jgi:hypothetical protein